MGKLETRKKLNIENKNKSIVICITDKVITILRNMSKENKPNPNSYEIVTKVGYIIFPYESLIVCTSKLNLISDTCRIIYVELY